MKVELKSIKHCQALSHETNAFTAKVYVDGKHVGDAENAGHGGPTHVQTAWKGKKDEKGYPIYSDADTLAIKELEEWAKKNNKYGLEGLIDDLLYEELDWREYQKIKRKDLLYYDPNPPEDKPPAVYSFAKNTLTQKQINSGGVEAHLATEEWWKDEYVFLNPVGKDEFMSKYNHVLKGEV